MLYVFIIILREVIVKEMLLTKASLISCSSIARYRTAAHRDLTTLK